MNTLTERKSMKKDETSIFDLSKQENMEKWKLRRPKNMTDREFEKAVNELISFASNPKAAKKHEADKSEK